MSEFQKLYRDKIVDELMKKFGYKSVMQVPQVDKITLNMGLGEAVADKKVVGHALGDLSQITGQKAVSTMARKSALVIRWCRDISLSKESM